MRHSRIWPAFSTGRRWRCNPRHTREIRGPGSPRRGHRRPSAELGCLEGKPVSNPSGACLGKEAIWRSGSTEPAGQSGAIRCVVPTLVATAGLRGFTLSQRIGLGCAGQVRYRLLPRSARVCKTIWGATRYGRPRRILAAPSFSRFNPSPPAIFIRRRIRSPPARVSELCLDRDRSKLEASPPGPPSSPQPPGGHFMG
jgi:hypothetical protein